MGFFWDILLAAVWVLMTRSFEFLNYVFGFIIGYLVILLMSRSVSAVSDYPRRLPRAIFFLLYFIEELVKANLKVAIDIITPAFLGKPGVIGLELDAKTNLEITLVANVISLTPGTLSLDVSANKKILFVHAMYLTDEDTVRADLKNLEQRLLKVMRYERKLC
ncbi:MAG: multicomponent Na+:H+ antiporter subunit E [Cellvibrionaceae bacterium]|jgi:multicomponent Na+:H+ antiporter subunit E